MSRWLRQKLAYGRKISAMKSILFALFLALTATRIRPPATFSPSDAEKELFYLIQIWLRARFSAKTLNFVWVAVLQSCRAYGVYGRR
jgi:hypothetical protein